MPGLPLTRFRLPRSFPEPVLALGGDQQSRFGLARGKEIMIAPNFGDLRSPGNLAAYEEALSAACRAEKFTPRTVVRDLHPAAAAFRLAPRLARSFSPPADVAGVQHHHAHLAAVLAEHGWGGEAIGVIWDGTGYGPDGAAWGGEFLVGDFSGSRRAAHLEYVPLPGGDKAVLEPWRMAFAYLHHCGRTEAFPPPGSPGPHPEELELLGEIIEKQVNSPPTSSMGRLFDGVSALLGMGWINARPAAAAAALERAAAAGDFPPYPFGINRDSEPYLIELCPLFAALLDDLAASRPRGEIAARFHSTVIAIGVETARLLSRETGLKKVVLSGGVFYNRRVREGLPSALAEAGLEPLLPLRLEPGDGGLALGQAAAVSTSPSRKESK
ncbi:MAG: hypothetical protein P9M08_01165 [Candidatus Erginobacter occultus]|nr:hypothetical protein [Candidatus Erginobacter occultus]